VPFFGPTTVLDGSGAIVRVMVGPVGYIGEVPLRNSLYGLGAVDLRAQALSAGAIVDTAALDRYLFIRNAYLQRRQYLLYDGNRRPNPRSNRWRASLLSRGARR
jgi:phospholipid-binding lipoprotein MlaA